MTNRQQPTPPLWEVMRDAYNECDDGTLNAALIHRGYGAELRAIADEVVPEKPQPVPYYGKGGGDDVRLGRWLREQEIRQRLLAEADRADRGEGQS